MAWFWITDSDRARMFCFLGIFCVFVLCESALKAATCVDDLKNNYHIINRFDFTVCDVRKKCQRPSHEGKHIGKRFNFGDVGLATQASRKITQKKPDIF